MNTEPMPGNQTWLADVPAQALADRVVNPFKTLCWMDSEAPLSRDSILARVASGDMLAPDGNALGDGGELISMDDHERRVAWLYAHGMDDWTPLLLSQLPLGTGEPYVQLEDGHHRLSAAMLHQADVRIRFTLGYRHDIGALVDAMQGRTIAPASTPLFGESVFLTSCGRRGFQVSILDVQHVCCWIEDVVDGNCVARYSDRLWEVYPSGLSSVRSAGMSASDHLADFIASCEGLLGHRDAGFRKYLHHHIDRAKTSQEALLW